MDEYSEQALAELSSISRKIISDNIPALRVWLRQQSEIDMQDMTLSAAQRAMAVRIFKRASHTGEIDEQATDLEIDCYFCDAHILREVVPEDIVAINNLMEKAAISLAVTRELAQ
ncbi:hypothetical protein [Actimicrobium sp. CCI2.3]|uniref:hypothetical protein n=1 Tax=Actimicrobium sp. CCI2.3 TaxID=3048616 RepID=UPI002AB3F275|nr:hypothetical protein [Actimicrobium sp. CCI2.3]MDY7573505.1 hypothetical protein [Actimicrobium sp. CCI2.3]MEB0022686.1 hypothetical protein [Actimicrobium sp. CCI2.3]